MMTQQEKEDFTWMTARLAELSAALHSPLTSELATAGIGMLRAHISTVLPAINDAVAAAQQVARKSMGELMAREGPPLWHELHLRAFSPVADHDAERRYLDFLATRLPCGACRVDYLNYLRTNPPDFRDYFGWTVRLHNFVNKKLDKPMMDYETALAYWSPKVA